MSAPVKRDRDVYLSFFMFTVDLRPTDPEYTRVVVRHMKELRALGYAGFDLPVYPTDGDRAEEVEQYATFRRELDRAGLDDVGVTTNVAATRVYDPTSPYREQREAALDYLKSRVDITAALGGRIMAGPIVLPYNVYPLTATGDPIWSDALQDWIVPRYAAARPVLDELGEYAATRGVTLAIEPVDHWEQAGPNMLGDVQTFLEGLASPSVGVAVDSAHMVLGSTGPETFRQQVRQIADAGQLNYVQVSAPDRGAVRDSWIPWETFLGATLPRYSGPLLIEVFNAIPVFLDSLRLTRRKFWIPGEDTPVAGWPDAYTVAAEGIEALEKQISSVLERTVDE